MNEIINWIMAGPEWIQYRCLIDLLDMPEDDPRVKQARAGLLKNKKVLNLIEDMSSQWESVLLKRHNDAAHPTHKLCFLADLGLTINDPGIREITAIVMKHKSEEGPYQVLSNFPTVFGGSGKDEWLWCLCDTPLIIYALWKLGLNDHPDVNAGLDFLAGLVRENGWPCKACQELENFKGPGKRSDPCPYANLIMLKTLAARANQDDLEKIDYGVKTALYLWEHSREERPFLFKMGNDFRKLKVPFIWYDILHLADVISQFPQYHQDKRYQEILAVIRSKADSSFKFKSESIWTKWKEWEFCQKREPSRWVTLCVLRIFKRTGL